MVSLSRSIARYAAAAGAAGLAGLAVRDVLQPRHSILRTFPIMGRARFAMERVRP